MKKRLAKKKAKQRLEKTMTGFLKETDKTEEKKVKSQS